MPSPPRNVYDLWMVLNNDQREKFATDAGTSVGYLANVFIYARKWPRIETIEGVSRACNEAGFRTTPENVLLWAYQRRSAALTERKRRARKKVRDRLVRKVANG